MLTSYFMCLALIEVVGLHGNCLEDCRFTMVFAQRYWECATPQAKWVRIGSSKGSLKVQIYDML